MLLTKASFTIFLGYNLEMGVRVSHSPPTFRYLQYHYLYVGSSPTLSANSWINGEIGIHESNKYLFLQQGEVAK